MVLGFRVYIICTRSSALIILIFRRPRSHSFWTRWRPRPQPEQDQESDSHRRICLLGEFSSDRQDGSPLLPSLLWRGEFFAF